MNKFNQALYNRVNDLGLGETLQVYLEALLLHESEEITEIIDVCENEYYYIDVIMYNEEDKYNTGRIVITFDDDSRLCNTSYLIHLGYVSHGSKYLPKLIIEKNQFMKGFVLDV